MKILKRLGLIIVCVAILGIIIGCPEPETPPRIVDCIIYEKGTFTPIDYSSCKRLTPDALLSFLNEDFDSSEGWQWFTKIEQEDPPIVLPEPIYYPDVDEETAVYFDCILTGEDEWQLQLLQRDFVLKNKCTYEITIVAKSEPDRTIQVGLGMTTYPWTSYSVEKLVPLTSTFTPHKFVFKLNTPTNEHGENGMKIDINVGAEQIDDSKGGFKSFDGSKVWIDKCYIRELEKADVVKAESKTNKYGKKPIINPFVGTWKEEGTKNLLKFWSNYEYDGVFANALGDISKIYSAFYNFDIIQIDRHGNTYNEYDEQGDNDPANDTDVEGNFVLQEYPFSDYIQTHGYSFNYDGTKLRLNLVQSGPGTRKWQVFTRQPCDIE